MSDPVERRAKTFSERTILPRPKKETVRTIGHTRQLGGRLARSEAEAMANDRRKAVYENPDAVYTGTEAVRLPHLGTPERDALVEKLKAMKGDGATHMEAAVALEIEVAHVAMLCQRHGIKSVKRAKGGRTP